VILLCNHYIYFIPDSGLVMLLYLRVSVRRRKEFKLCVESHNYTCEAISCISAGFNARLFDHHDRLLCGGNVDESL
jgi:hypothetical protein